MHWGINYLRREITALRESMDAGFEALQRRIDSRFYLTMAMMATTTGALGTLMIV